MTATSTITRGAVRLDVPFADVTAADLRLSIGGAVPATLAEVTIAPHPDAPATVPPLTLGILGSSHVAVIGDAADPAHVEELSCTAVGGVPLRSAEMPGVRVTTMDRPGFRAVVTQLRTMAREASALVAEFPGADGAITAVRGEALPDGYRWATWHLYPDADGGEAAGGEVVATESTWRTGDRR